MSRISNLFVDFHATRYGTTERRYGSGWENLFTEQFAFFLSCDLSAATAIARALLSRPDVEVSSVATQIVSSVGIPDLVMKLQDGTCLYVEHKFDSPLGIAQLERYATLGAVALVSRCAQTVPLQLLTNPRYCRPSEREYFHWVDIYEALPPASAAPPGYGGLRDHFRGYMRELGLAPTSLTSEWRRLFEDRTQPENQRVRKDFGRLLNPVKAQLRARGLRVQDVSYMAKQAYAPDGSHWLHLYIRPDRVRADYLEPSDCAAFEPGYVGLVVEVVFDSERADAAQALHVCLRDQLSVLERHHWFVLRPRPIGRDRVRVSLATPLGPLLSQPDLSGALSNSAQWALEHALTHLA